MIVLFGKNKLDVIFLARWSPDDIIASPFPLNRLHNRVIVFMRKYLNSYPPIISRDFFLLKPQVYVYGTFQNYIFDKTFAVQ